MIPPSRLFPLSREAGEGGSEGKSPFNFLLLILAASFFVGGLRHPAAWSAAALLLWAGAWKRPPRRFPNAPLWLAWLAWCALSSAACKEPLVALGALGEAATAVLVFALASDLDGRGRRECLWILLATAPLLWACALLVSPPGYPMAGILPPYYNYTACFEAAALSAAAALVCSKTIDGPRRWLLLAVAGAAALEIAQAGSRGGACAAIVGAGVALARAPRPSRRPRIELWVGAAGAAIALAVIFHAPLLRFATKPWSAGANRRPQLWAAALRVTNDHPLLGEGPGLFALGFARHDFPSELGVSRYGLSSSHAHSELLQAAAETGWPGLALLLAAWLATAAVAVRRKADPVRAAALAACAAMTAQALVDNVFALPGLRLWYACALAVAAGGREAGEGRGEGKSPWPLVAAAGVLLSVWGRWPVPAARSLFAKAEISGDARALRLGRLIEPAAAEGFETEARLAERKHPPDMEAARRALEGATVASPFDASYPQMLAEFAASQGDWKTALERARRASELEPVFLEARLVEAEALARLGRRQEAGRALEAFAAARRQGAALSPLSQRDRMMLFADENRLRRVAELVR
ncbi:MAG: O-antigen ligase family protein [Elusimicrobia bacterium]|nr:O-antigen ligase family protein [Elusimicrobiota bacterium]